MKKLLSFLASGVFLMTAFPLFAQDGANEAAPSSGGSMIQTLIMIAVALVFPLLTVLSASQQKQRRQRSSSTTISICQFNRVIR